jgi:hypothetical protein
MAIAPHRRGGGDGVKPAGRRRKSPNCNNNMLFYAKGYFQ